MIATWLLVVVLQGKNVEIVPGFLSESQCATVAQKIQEKDFVFKAFCVPVAPVK